MHDGCAPRWDNRRLDFDWSAWDRRFGPLLDGSAFADLPRKGVPVERFYLPLHENWPSPMEGNYNGDYWADRAFPEAYRQAFVAAARQIAEHFRAKSWNETLFQCFLNNKNNFKARGWSRGSSPWLLDEPANFQDYWALRYFARAFHEGINQAVRMGGRDARRLLPGWSSAPTFPGRNGGATVSTACWTTTWSAARCASIRGWSSTASGPWARSCSSTARPTRSRARISSRSPGAWTSGRWVPTASFPGKPSATPNRGTRADELSLFYPGRGTGPRSRADPFDPSQGLSPRPAGRRIPDALVADCATSRAGRSASRCARALKLSGTRQATGFSGGEDAGRIDYGRLRAAEISGPCGPAIGEALSQAHPAPRSKLVDFRTPRREPERLRPVFVGTPASQ